MYTSKPFPKVLDKVWGFWGFHDIVFGVRWGLFGNCLGTFREIVWKNFGKMYVERGSGEFSAGLAEFNAVSKTCVFTLRKTLTRRPLGFFGDCLGN